jgi:hypothetical protein
MITSCFPGILYVDAVFCKGAGWLCALRELLFSTCGAWVIPCGEEASAVYRREEKDWFGELAAGRRIDMKI